ncbi:MAG: hypothetical protein R2830_24775 [Saprospiraceae bacterium]
MKNFLAISLLCIVLSACSKSEDNAFETLNEIGNTLNGDYSGILILDRQNAINGNGFGWKDTFELQFSIKQSAFNEGECIGQVVTKSDTISFQSNECSCYCDCAPWVDCGGNLLLGTRFFSFDGDSLLMWSEASSTDTTSLPGFHLDYEQKASFFLKKQ